jgi:bifunctional ADP-heptose synthase (sugar kinase/adenylyltransferase)
MPDAPMPIAVHVGARRCVVVPEVPVAIETSLIATQHGGLSNGSNEINRALAKAIAYKQVGKDDDARLWARRLIHLLELADILKEPLKD